MQARRDLVQVTAALIVLMCFRTLKGPNGKAKKCTKILTVTYLLYFKAQRKRHEAHLFKALFLTSSKGKHLLNIYFSEILLPKFVAYH